MKGKSNSVILSQNDRQLLEDILKSPNTTQYDKTKAQVLLLTDLSEFGSKILSKDVADQLKISPRTIVRIREVYAKKSSIEDVFLFANFSVQKKDNVENSLHKKQRNTKKIKINEENFVSESIKCRVTLNLEERKQLEVFIKEGKQTLRKFNRAKILLLADESIHGPAQTDNQIAIKLNVCLSTVASTRRIFVNEGTVESVLNFKHHRAGRMPKIDGNIQAVLIAQVCGKAPDGYAKWTLRLLADRLIELEVIDSISPTAIGNALKKMNLNLGNEKNG